MSDAKRKPSGSEFKKRRLNKQTQLQKQSDALQNFLKEGSFNAPTTDQHLKNAQHLDTDFPDMDPPLDATVSITELEFSIGLIKLVFFVVWQIHSFVTASVSNIATASKYVSV
ncbi:hypothetical protein Avbf_17289 [Armadillidium vulgare]|nr:hypothetical protein Avbf_17289 [Armadillidium vulgare]